MAEGLACLAAIAVLVVLVVARTTGHDGWLPEPDIRESNCPEFVNPQADPVYDC